MPTPLTASRRPDIAWPDPLAKPAAPPRSQRQAAIRHLGAQAALLLGCSTALAQTPPQEPASAAEPAKIEQPAEPDPADDEPSTQGITWRLELDAPEALKPLLLRYLDLARYQRSDGKARITRAELSRLLAAAPAQVRQLLETEGYFDPKVRAEPIGSAAGDADQPIRLILHIDPGVLTRVAGVQLDIVGPLADAADARHGADPDLAGSGAERDTAAASTLIAQLRRQWSLPEGRAFTREAWDDAKSGVLTLLRSEGYAAVAWEHSEAQVDPAQHRAMLTLRLHSGPLFRFGAFHFEGLEHVRMASLLALRNVPEGAPLREQSLLNYQDRLVKTGLFDTVAVTYDPDPDQASAVPILIRVRERALQQATVGVGTSDLSGPRVTLEHIHQQPFGLHWQAKTKLQLGRSASSLSLDLTSHPEPGPHRNLIAAAFSQTDASGLRVSSERLRIGRTQDTERIERTYYFEWQRALTHDLSTMAISDDTSALTYNYQWVWRRLDHPVLPTEGWSLSANGAVGRSFASQQRDGWFGRLGTRLTNYWTLGDNWYGQTRVELGQVVAPASVAIPYTLLFRAGGDDSVRGYGYQSLGPTDASGSAVGGRVLGVGSVELARPFSLAHPAWWGAVFVDGGNAATQWADWQPAWGYGVGLRWRSPVGALRIDLAWGQQVRHLRFHFTVGITF
ncbi:MAG TPA: BamA/TamA family outer membrane protein [Burkholderiaceae bacterium]|nr:BamA/TamA family outer membrane protein [Burkholderiaceae bacterium]HNB46105.1 BamA/TamA family outer membrane protein [Burkholderiaceae bacterium]HNG81948.1 BamA/TamA family outer membrane protein [Burkholderiaceae bacterium]